MSYEGRRIHACGRSDKTYAYNRGKDLNNNKNT